MGARAIKPREVTEVARERNGAPGLGCQIHAFGFAFPLQTTNLKELIGCQRRLLHTWSVVTSSLDHPPPGTGSDPLTSGNARCHSAESQRRELRTRVPHADVPPLC